jgi:hypothetical protein
VGASPLPATTFKENTMSDQIPTKAEVEALQQAWIASRDLNSKNYIAYYTAKRVHEAGPDTQQILHEALAALSEASDAVKEARIAHARATR